MIDLYVFRGRLGLLAFVLGLIFTLQIGSLRRAQAQDLIEVEKSLTVTANNAASARQAIIDETIQKATYDVLLKLLGAQKFEASRKLIDERILPDSNRFVAFVRPGAVESSGDEYTMPVSLKISMVSLRQLMTEKGIMVETEATMRLLPLVRFVDQASSATFEWWNSAEASSGGLTAVARQYLASVATDLKSKSIVALSPLEGQLARKWPSEVSTSSWTAEELRTIALSYGVDLLLIGEVSIETHPKEPGRFLVQVQTRVRNIASGRDMAFKFSKLETEPGPFDPVVVLALERELKQVNQDLANQLSEITQRGALRAQVVGLVFPRLLFPKELEEMKLSFIQEYREVKSVKERLISATSTVLELEVTTDPNALASAIESRGMAGKKLNVSQVTPTQIIFR